MPFKSEKQRRFLWANEPEVAEKFAHDTKKPAKKGAFHHLKKSMQASKKHK